MNAPKARGFILLEVMLAFVVLGGAIVVLFQFYRTSLEMVRSSRQSYQAAVLLEDHLGTQEKAGAVDLESFDDPVLGAASWQQDSVPGDDEAWHTERMTLHWGDDTHEQTLDLSTPVLDN